MCNNAGYNLIADPAQSVARCAARFRGPEEKARCDELALEITSQKNTPVRRSSGKQIYNADAGELSRESLPVSSEWPHDHPRDCKR